MEKETVRSDEGPSANRRERTRSEGCLPEEEEEEEEDHHYALFVGNDWHGLKKLQKRR
ncbi:hypothetical protein Hanom_Chr06g00526141 [Helianthus anomalus]